MKTDKIPNKDLSILGAMLGVNHTDKIVGIHGDNIWLVPYGATEPYKTQLPETHIIPKDTQFDRLLPSGTLLDKDIRFTGLLPVGTLLDAAYIANGRLKARAAITAIDEFDLPTYYELCRIGMETNTRVTAGVVEIVGAVLTHDDINSYVYLVKPYNMFPNGKTDRRFIGATIRYSYMYKGTNGIGETTINEIDSDCYYGLAFDGCKLKIGENECQHHRASVYGVTVVKIHPRYSDDKSILPIGTVIESDGRGLPIAFSYDAEGYTNTQFSNFVKVHTIYQSGVYNYSEITYDVKPVFDTSKESAQYKFTLVPC